ncbi:MAG: prolipoprotein diacylglyceryl transferase [Gammaproteobacteria bacterium]|nr:prolipoprotein diacylglyceryl transferase [Gammaproteobacteria bacterium]
MILHPNFDPVAISIGPISIHWYGLMYLIGFSLGWWIGYRRASGPENSFQPKEVGDLLFYVALGVILGGRLGYMIFYQIGSLLEQPWSVFAIWDGGMSFHGGLVGVILACWFYAKHKQHHPLAVFDFLVPLIPPGLFFGRIGNFINQELWGRVTDVPWAVQFYTADLLPRHPSQIYEAMLEGVALFLVLTWFASKPRPLGSVSALFLLGYGGFRFLVEFFREPDLHLGTIAFGWLTMGQLLCVPMVALGLILMLRAYQQIEKSN